MKLTYDTLRKLILEEMGKIPVLETPEMLAEKSIMKNKNPFKAVFVLGPAGAGKSFLSNHIGIPGDFKTSNPDERIESVFPAFGMSMKFAEFDPADKKAASSTAKIQQTAREVLQNAEQAHTANLLSIANPLLFDTTGEDVAKISGRMKALMRLGYDVGIFMVNVPTDVSVDRDKKRDRTVGEPTKAISKSYQQQVVQDRGYFKKLSNEPYATIFGGDIYANLYDLRDNSLLPGITDAHVAAMKTADGSEYTPEYAKNLLAQAQSEMKGWLGEPANPKGQVLLRGMKALVSASGGKLGQNLMQVGPAYQSGEFDDKAIKAAAEHLASLGGAEDALAQTQRGRKKAGKKFGVDDAGIRSMTGKTDGSEVPMGGDLPTKDAKGNPKKRKFEEARLTKKIEEAIWEMLRRSKK